MRVLFGHNKGQGGHILVGHGLSASADAIAALYSGAFADVGFYLPLDDRTYMWQEHTGQTPVTSDNDTVGLVLDKSQGVRVTESLGPELVTNGTFDTDSDWTKGTGWAISGGAATKTPGTAGAINQTSSLEAGKTYKCVVTISGFTTGALYWRLGSTTNIGIMGANGAITQYLEASATGTYLGLFADINFDGSIDNISVREVQRTLTGLGDELVTNGGFDTDSDWTKGTGWTISGGTASVNTATSSNLTQTSVVSANRWYRVTFDISNFSGTGGVNFSFPASGTTEAAGLQNGSHDFIFFSKTATGNIEFSAQGILTCDLDNVSVREVPGNHAYQNTAASRPIWNATEEGVDFDGTDDALKVDAISGLTTTMSLIGVLRSNDGLFSILQTFDNPNDRVIDGQTGNSANGNAELFYADGVKIYNASRGDVKNAIAQSVLSDTLFEARNDNMNAWLTDNVSIAGGANGSFVLNGILKGSLVLTSNTSTSALDRARNYAAGQEGITLRNTETLTDQVATGGVYGPSNDTRLMFQDTDGDPYTDTDQDPVGLIINPAEGVSVSESGGVRTFSGLGSEEITNGDMSAEPTFNSVGVTGFQTSSAVSDGTLRTNVTVTSSTSNFRIVPNKSSLYGSLLLVTMDMYIPASFTTVVPRPVEGGSTKTLAAITDRDEWMPVSYITHYQASGDRPLQFEISNGSSTTDKIQIDNLSVKEIPGAHLYQTTAAARPLYDEASGLYDFDGTDDHLIADLTGIGTRTNMYFAFVVNTTDAEFCAITSASVPSYFALVPQDASATTTFSSNAGSPVYYVDGTLQAWTTRDDAHTAICDGSKHLVEVVGLDLSSSNYDTIWAMIYQSGGLALDGLAGEFVLIPDPGVVGRNIIRRDILARHPSITFAGA